MNLEELNPSQREAVLCIDAPSLVIAGAGSGKTRVLTYKIAYLLEQGMQPWNILALTFTNKAAREMRERIATLVSPEKAASLWMGTFHSIFAKILRVEGHRLGFDQNYTIYDAADSASLIRLVIKEMNLDEKVYKPSAVQNRISAAKNRLVLPSGYASVREFRENDAYYHRTLMPEVYNHYEERLKQSNAMDFDDLLLNTWLLFKHNPEVAAHWQERFQFVLVDEYQDTNYAQHQIIKLLTDQRQRVCVVGDDAQSIYSFRGANIDNILHFCEAYPGTRLFKLERNYRSTQTIVNAAGSLIRNNREQISKSVFSEKEVGNPIALFSAYSDTDEANIILREVQRAHRAGIPYKGMAVLYRTNAQSRKIEDGFLQGRVPYHIYAGTSFYQREEIKDMLCYLRLSVNPYDEESLRRVINKPARGIGDTTVGKLFLEARAAGSTVWEALGTMKEQGAKGKEQGKASSFNAGTVSRLLAFYDMIASFHESSLTDDAYALALRIAKESGLEAHYFSGHDPDDISKQENFQEMLDGIGLFVQDNREQGLGISLSDYLQMASLATDFDRTNAEKDADQVNMMTIHSAKGLEFPVVFIAGLEEGLFPSEMSAEVPRELEEERRLFYVALTRAERQVVLTYAKSRFRNGRMEFSRPSRFIREIPQQFYKASQSASSPSQPRIEQRMKPLRLQNDAGGFAPPTRPFSPTNRATTSVQSSVSDDLKVGSAVVHERFGRGVVQALEGSGIDAKATVLFENAGTKVLMLRFAKLTLQ
ncbi:MAG: UvrD-helicase domain-containing protein [Bacteroidaceae bacterium]|nr:UvrD-helicase domain-containing protein [Bacteroidaceae bacterium]